MNVVRLPEMRLPPILAQRYAGEAPCLQRPVKVRHIRRRRCAGVGVMFDLIALNRYFRRLERGVWV